MKLIFLFYRCVRQWVVVEIGWAGRRVEHCGGGKARGGCFEYSYINVVLNVN